MLNLDQIAQARAAALTQESREWLNAVWSEGFQKLSARLTDGEVLDLLALCPSARALVRVTTRLLEVAADQSVTPYDWLKNEAVTAGISAAEWVRRAEGEP